MTKFCQGPKCHTYMTTDRKRGTKGSKYFQTRTVGRYGYGDNHFCTQSCWSDWWVKHGTRAVDHFGRLHEPIRLTPDNAWRKEYDYHYQPNSDNHQRNWRFVNRLTKETRSLTKEQYDDDNLVRP